MALLSTKASIIARATNCRSGFNHAHTRACIIIYTTCTYASRNVIPRPSTRNVYARITTLRNAYASPRVALSSLRGQNARNREISLSPSLLVLRASVGMVTVWFNNSVGVIVYVMRSEKERIYAIKTFGKHFVFMKGNDIRERSRWNSVNTHAQSQRASVWILYCTCQLHFFNYYFLTHMTHEIYILLYLFIMIIIIIFLLYICYILLYFCYITTI